MHSRFTDGCCLKKRKGRIIKEAQCWPHPTSTHTKKKSNNLVNKQASKMNRQLTKEEILIVSRHVRSTKQGVLPGTHLSHASLNTQSHSLALVMPSISPWPGLLHSFYLQQMETVLGIHSWSDAEIWHVSPTLMAQGISRKRGPGCQLLHSAP